VPPLPLEIVSDALPFTPSSPLRTRGPIRNNWEEDGFSHSAGMTGMEGPLLPAVLPMNCVEKFLLLYMLARKPNVAFRQSLARRRTSVLAAGIKRFSQRRNGAAARMKQIEISLLFFLRPLPTLRELFLEHALGPKTGN
jgi:hypothetical protein